MKPLVTGALTRGYSSSVGHQSALGGFVHIIDWNLFETSPRVYQWDKYFFDPLQSTSLRNRLAAWQAVNRPAGVRVRFNPGLTAPDHVKALDGGPVYLTLPRGAAGYCPIVWGDQYVAKILQLVQDLATGYGSTQGGLEDMPECLELQFSWGGLDFSEFTIRPWGVAAANRDAARALTGTGAFSEERDRAAIRAMMDAQFAAFPNTPMTLWHSLAKRSLPPAPGAYYYDQAWTDETVRYCRAKFGQNAVNGNNDISSHGTDQYAVAGQKYYAVINSGRPIGYQTEATVPDAQWPDSTLTDTLAWAIAQGARSFELPGGTAWVPTITDAALTTFGAQLKANATTWVARTVLTAALRIRRGNVPAPSNPSPPPTDVLTGRLVMTPATGTEPLAVLLDASGTTPATTSTGSATPITSYRFTPGDGSPDVTGTAARVPHTYAAGSWTASVEVTDSTGATSRAQASVVVDPIVSAGKNRFETLMGPGGGGQAGIAVSPFDENLVAMGTDTHAMSVSRDGGATTRRIIRGYRTATGRATNGLRWSRVVKGRLFFCAGNKGGQDGGVYVVDGLDTDTPGAAVQLDTITALISINGSGVSDPAGPPDYPRHYGAAGTILEIDETSVAGHTLVHVVTPSQGVVTLKVKVSATGVWTTVRQSAWAGTTGGFARCLRFAVSETNNASDDFAKAIVSMYDHRATATNPAQSMRLCTNANRDDGTAPTTTAIGGPNNVEALSYVKGTKPGAVPVLAAVKAGEIHLSTNAFTAAAGAIAFNQVTGRAGEPPSTASYYYAAVELAEVAAGGDYRIMVGLSNPPPAPGPGNTSVVRGIFSATDATPWGAGDIAWAIQDGSNTSYQVMNKAGAANTYFLINGPNSPGGNTSGFATCMTRPSRVYYLNRGCTYRSDDGGIKNYPIWVYSTWCAWNLAQHPTRPDWYCVVTADWPALCTVDGEATEAFGLVKGQPQTAAACYDEVTDETLYGGTNAGGTHSTPRSAANDVWGITAADMLATAASRTPMTVARFTARSYKLDTGGGAGAASTGCPGHLLVYRSRTGVRGLLVMTYSGDGLHYAVNPDPAKPIAWKHFSGVGDPYAASQGNNTDTSIAWDPATNRLLGYDRGASKVWTAKINDDASLTSPVTIAVLPPLAGFPPDSTGYVAFDTSVPGRAWISHSNDVYYTDVFTTAADMSNLKATGAFAPGGPYAGEMPGPMVMGAGGKLTLFTVAFINTKTPAPGSTARGVRTLDVVSPHLLASWRNAFDRCADDARGRQAFHPSGVAATSDGKRVSIIQQTCGGGGRWIAP